MNSLGPSLSRMSCLNSRTIFQTCYKVNSFATELAQRSARAHSNWTAPYIERRIDPRQTGFGGGWNGTNNSKFMFRHCTRTFASNHRIITKFQDLPKTYDPKVGLRFRDNSLCQDEVRTIFGEGLDVKKGNRLMRLVQGRRVAGTLEDPEISRLLAIEEHMQNRALKWLREHVPIDEVQNAGQRAEQELQDMEADIVADSERLGLYAPNSQKTSDVYGKSGLDAIRRHKERNLDKMEKERERELSQAEEIRQKTGTLSQVNPRGAVELERSEPSERMKYYIERGQISEMKKPQEMSAFQRLFPSLMVVLGTLLAMYVFTQVYTPPKNSARLWPDTPPSAATITGIILSNAIILLMWRIPPLYRFMNMNFITVPGYIFPFSMIGSALSHQAPIHLLVNMALLWFVGTRLHEEVGRANFLAIYLSCGVMGNFVSLTSYVVRNLFITSSLGASGAVSGVVGAYLWLNASDKVTLFGVFPPKDWPTFSALGLLTLLIISDLYGALRKHKVVRIDHWNHLGGYATGIVAAEALNYQYRQKKEREKERRKNMSAGEKIMDSITKTNSGK
ncbi:hypothetical protein BGZ60DRAFT_412565 [Tricladium varicosporioides]|nr:hypothetical protein BGZ60DRAFT_412565 [Hymenoscyphus varicosporioides]